MILTVLMGAISAVSFSWIAETCAMTRSSTYRQAWSRTVSEESSWIPAVSITLTTFGGCVAFSMAMGDNLTALLLVDRTTVIWLTTIFVFAPLCWMKNLKNLAPFSLLGVLGIVYTAIAMTVQYFRGSYLDGSPLLEEVALDLRPSFGSEGWQSVFKPNSIILISMLSTAYKVCIIFPVACFLLLCHFSFSHVISFPLLAVSCKCSQGMCFYTCFMRKSLLISYSLHLINLLFLGSFTLSSRTIPCLVSIPSWRQVLALALH